MAIKMNDAQRKLHELRSPQPPSKNGRAMTNQRLLPASGLTRDAKTAIRELLVTLRQDGGWWNLDMLSRQWRPTDVLHGVQSAMDALEAGGFVESRGYSASLAYAVTANCKGAIEFDAALNQEME